VEKGKCGIPADVQSKMKGGRGNQDRGKKNRGGGVNKQSLKLGRGNLGKKLMWGAGKT